MASPARDIVQASLLSGVGMGLAPTCNPKMIMSSSTLDCLPSEGGRDGQSGAWRSLRKQPFAPRMIRRLDEMFDRRNRTLLTHP